MSTANMADRIADLSMIWKQASQIFPYFDQNPIDWDGKYREYIDKVMSAKTDKEVHLILAEFINLLGDGHTDYMFPKALQDEIGYLPFLLRSIEDGYCIIITSPAYEKFYGARILSINGIAFSEFIRDVSRYSYHVGTFASRINQMLPFFLKRYGNQVETTLGSFTFDLSDTPLTGMQPRALTLPYSYQKIDSEKLDIRIYDGGILYVKLYDFLYNKVADEVRAAIEQTDGLKGVILDLREDRGGMTVYGAELAKLLISGTFHACKKRTRSATGSEIASASQIARWSKEAIEEHISAGYATREEMDECIDFIKNRHYNRYENSYGADDHTALFSGPCVLLTSRYTASAAEDFVAMFRTSRRATIVGTPTSGTTGTPLMEPLLCGGWFRVVSIGYQMMDGSEFIGHGIEPDIFCETTEADLRSGYDTVLENGLNILKNQISNS